MPESGRRHGPGSGHAMVFLPDLLWLGLCGKGLWEAGCELELSYRNNNRLHGLGGSTVSTGWVERRAQFASIERRPALNLWVMLHSCSLLLASSSSPWPLMDVTCASRRDPRRIIGHSVDGTFFMAMWQ